MERLRVAHRRRVLVPGVAHAFPEYFGMGEIFGLDLREPCFRRPGGKIFHHPVAAHQERLEEIAVRRPRESFQRIRAKAQDPRLRQPAAVRVASLNVRGADGQEIRQIIRIDQRPRQVDRPVHNSEARRIDGRIAVVH